MRGGDFCAFTIFQRNTRKNFIVPTIDIRPIFGYNK